MLKNMERKKCYVCGKVPLTKDEIGLTKKIIDKKSQVFYCLPCLAEYLEVTEDELIAKIEQFKEEGCTLFK
jgi:biotin operon repressor